MEDHVDEDPSAMARSSTAPCDVVSPSNALKFSSMQYVIFTDSELEQVRRSYFEKQRLGKEQEVTLSKELYCRLVRNTMTNMIAIACASQDSRYPTKHKVTSMAKRLVEYYPMIKDNSSDSVWEDVSKRLMKRLSNIKSPVKSKAPPAKKQRQDGDADESLSSTMSDCDSSASTVILETSLRASTPKRDNQVSQLGDSEDEPYTLTVPEPMDREKTQAQHHHTLQMMFKSKKPNKAAVSQLLNLEFSVRRKFIDSDTIREQDRPGKILEAYPCFRDLDHIMDEFRRIVEKDNIDFLKDLRERWDSFYGKVQYYGVVKHVMKAPLTMDGVEHAIAVFTAALSIKLEGAQPN
ncbi:uncharacterized protein LOC134100324 isoform X1 [Sardina pilchardus]|uniref:uncharacterized protein LOC134100324 isoform X1 n=1 Tax=Sardina pilchardus TaxID=27697 RepID=UPI002E15B182